MFAEVGEWMLRGCGRDGCLLKWKGGRSKGKREVWMVHVKRCVLAQVEACVFVLA